MLLKHSTIKREVGMFAYLFFIIIFLMPTHAALPQTAVENKIILAAYNNILELRIDKGRSQLIEYATDDEQEKLFIIYALDLADMLELLLIEDAEVYDQKKVLEKERLATVAECSDSNPWKKFCEAEIKLHWAFVKVKYGDELSSVWNFNQSYKAIISNLEEFPDFLPNQKAFGIFNIVFGAVPQKYRWLLSLFSMKGSTDNGIAALKLLADSGEPLSLESYVLLQLTNAYLMDNAQTAISKLNLLTEERKDNKLLKYLLGITLLKNSQAEKALKAIKEADDLEKNYLTIAYTDYIKGEIMLQMGNYTGASACYTSFLLNYKGENFVKDAYYKLFLSKYLSGDNRAAEVYLEKAKNSGNTLTEADKYAERQISFDSYPNKDILKIRLATDGGFFILADSLIKSLSTSDFTLEKDQVEFVYRKARLFDKSKLTEKAIKHYKLTLEKAGNNNWYFAPNAALQLGYIYAEKGQKKNAQHYFKKVLTYDNYEYKNSIDNKAEAGLQKLK